VTAAKRKRLRPGELDDLVLAYIGKNRADSPLTASAIAKGIGRSSGAVANCLRRLTKAKKLRQTKKSPRAYVVRKTRA
jgi:DNA-binding Lrp family transcriptional regulator